VTVGVLVLLAVGVMDGAMVLVTPVVADGSADAVGVADDAIVGVLLGVTVDVPVLVRVMVAVEERVGEGLGVLVSVGVAVAVRVIVGAGV
jgi:hypothetical protein